MQNAMRRTLGVGGATAVAIGATLALAGVASAHTHNVYADCGSNDTPTLHITLSEYKSGKTNTITATAENGSFLSTTIPSGRNTTKTVTLDKYAFQKVR